MAHCIGYLQGSRGAISRLGGKGSGIRANVNTWNIGMYSYAGYDETKDQDFVLAYSTPGSGHKDPPNILIKVFADGSYEIWAENKMIKKEESK